MGGEKERAWARWNATLGSPPRGRGKVPGNGDLALCTGITPAWAGKREAKKAAVVVDRDHPRVGGEKPRAGVPRWHSTGSPPRGRGKALRRFRHVRAQWITPAWAGKSDYSLMTNYTFEDHPRVGGEKSVSGCFLCGQKGSPPRGRGKVEEQMKVANHRRITPAWAGKRPASIP